MRRKGKGKGKGVRGASEPGRSLRINPYRKSPSRNGSAYLVDHVQRRTGPLECAVGAARLGGVGLVAIEGGRVASAAEPRSVDWEAEAFQDPARRLRLDDRLQDPEPAVALRALEDIDVERPPKKLAPSQPWRSGVEQPAEKARAALLRGEAAGLLDFGSPPPHLADRARLVARDLCRLSRYAAGGRASDWWWDSRRWRCQQGQYPQQQQPQGSWRFPPS